MSKGKNIAYVRVSTVEQNEAGNERHWENIILISGLLRRHPVKR